MTNKNKLLFKDDVGIVLRVWAGPDLDLSSATALSLKVKKPYGTLVSWTATLASDNNYYATYTIVADDLNEIGDYQITLVANFTGGVILTGKTDVFTVVNRYDDILN
jgi:hypothetical protein